MRAGGAMCSGAARVEGEPLLSRLLDELRDISESTLLWGTLRVLLDAAFLHATTVLRREIGVNEEPPVRQQLAALVKAETRVNAVFLRAYQNQIVDSVFDAPPMQGLAGFVFSQFGDICGV